MFDRLPMLIGVGVITAGVSAAMLAGAGVAIAATESGTGGQASTSDSAGPGDGRAQSDKSDTDPDTQDAARAVDVAEASGVAEVAEVGIDVAEVGIDDDSEVAEADIAPDAYVDAGTREAGTREAGTREVDTQEDSKEDVDSNHEAIAPSALATPSTEALAPPTSPTGDGSADAELATKPAATPGQLAALVSVTSVTEPEAETKPTPVVEILAVASVADAPLAAATAPRQTLLSVVGSIIFNLYGFAIRMVSGPPLLPRGSTVTVHSSNLAVDCGDGYDVPADWYVPEGPTPTQLIYLQHGFLAAGPFYSYTASRLAEATHSIVVATSLTSNFLACDGCWVGGSPMHKAVADLFVDGNTALADSALAAGYSGSLLDGVEKVLLTGHSAGGGLAAGAAGYMTENGTIDRLAGAVMLDGVGFGSRLPEALAKLPDELPIYNIAGKAYFWNMNGSTGAALEHEWPGKFNGVRLIGGLHSDTMLGGNPLIQAGLNLVTGWSKIENVKAAEILSAAWMNDMFSGSSTSPYYGAAGTMLEIETTRGTAEAYVVPGPPERVSVIDVVFQYFADIIFGLNFATCATPPSLDSSAQPAGDVIELVTLDTALSLDGTAKPGQSIGQHVCTGF